MFRCRHFDIRKRQLTENDPFTEKDGFEKITTFLYTYNTTYTLSSKIAKKIYDKKPPKIEKLK